MRIEKDSLGEMPIEESVLYGIHTVRAINNFTIGKHLINPNLIKGMITVKKAAAMAHLMTDGYDVLIGNSIVSACDLLLKDFDMKHYPIAAIQGGAGTSLNMNINEVIANQALIIMGHKPGAYNYIDPLHHVNKSQSTNDVYPTALRIAAIYLLRKLSDNFSNLQTSLQEKEHAYSDIIKLGRTQMMDALPIMLGQEFGAYAQAVSRDRWRLYKVEERLRQINLGGTGIGTGLNAKKAYIFAVTECIRDLTGLGLARSEFPIDLTQNQDVFVEVSGLIKASAVNLIKISNDLRTMNAGPRGSYGEITLEPLQAGSSIMPGKINPIIPEAVISGCLRVIALDQMITQAAGMGHLELNPFLPVIAESLLESLEIMIDTTELLNTRCIQTLKANEERCKILLEQSTALATALSEHIGYDQAAFIAKKALDNNTSVYEEAQIHSSLTKEVLDSILDPYQITKPGIPGL